MESHNKLLIYNNYFMWVGFLKVQPSYQKIIMNIISNILKDLTYKKDHDKNDEEPTLINYFGPYIVFGQFDIIFGYAIANIDRGARLFYAILDSILSIDTQMQSALIRDFYRIVGFEWEHNHMPRREMSCCAYINAKFNYSSIRYQNLTTNKIIESLKNHNFHFRLLGTLSWYEILILLYGDSYEQLPEAIAKLREIDTISNITPIIVRDIEKPITRMPFTWWIATQLGSKDNFSKFDIDQILLKFNIKKAYHLKSTTANIITMPCSKIENMDAFLDALWKVTDLKYTNTNFYQWESIPYNTSHLSRQTSTKPQIASNNVNGQKVLTRLNEIEGINLSKRRLMALLTQIEILSGIDNLRHLSPIKIKKCIEFVLNKMENVHDTTLQYYVAEFNTAIADRLAGTQIDLVLGKDLGFLEKHGGYQRLLLACESLIHRCFILYLENRGFSFRKGEEPQIFVFFDYGARMSADIPAEILRQGLDENFPIIVRLRMLRYRPWLWISGLREVCKLLFYLVKGLSPDVVLPEDQEVITFSDQFLRHFLTKRNFTRVLAAELDFFRRVTHGPFKGGYRVNPMIEPELVRRVQAAESSSFSKLGALITNKDVEDYKRKLHRGELVFDLHKPEVFLNFLNAYQSLDMTSQRAARPFLTFTLSLYWSHPNLQERI